MALQRKIKVAIPKPPPIAAHQGKKMMKMTEPERSVTMDAGVFDYLWRIVESRHEQAPQHHPEYVDLLERAVGCFRRAVTADPEVTPEDFDSAMRKGTPVRIVKSRAEYEAATKTAVRRVVKRRT